MITQQRLSDTEILVKFSNDVSHEEVQQFSNKIVQSSYKTVIIDLSEVYHLNYAILGKLHMLKLDLSVRSKRLTFQGCSEKLINMLRLLKFDKTIEILRLSPKAHQVDNEPRKDKGDTIPD